MLIVGAILLIVVLVFMWMDGTFIPKDYSLIWTDEYIEGLEDVQSKMIAEAMRASSSHNMQPWRVKILATDKIELYADMSKTLPVVDEENNQLLISQGTFLENFNQSALRYGYNTEIEYGDLSDESTLVASIKLLESDDIDLVDVVSSSTYTVNDSKVEIDIEKIVEECISDYPDFSYSFLESSDDVEKLQKILLEGTIIESRNEEATKELLDVFRWTEREKNEYRYGLSLNSIPGIIKPFVQPLMKLSSNDLAGFGDSGIKMFEERLDLEHSYILLKIKDPSRIDYIHTGEIYQKLIYSVGGYELRPAMQVLEKFDAMKNTNEKFQLEYGIDKDVVLIIGVQNHIEGSDAHNPRHLVEDIIM
jgi:hypothetical protein